MEGAAVIDAHDDRLLRHQTGHACVARNRQRRVSGGHRVHIVGFAAGGALAVEFAPVPAANAALPERPQLSRRLVILAEHGVGIVGETVQWLGLGFCIGDGRQIDRSVLARAIVLVVAAATLCRGGRLFGRFLQLGCALHHRCAGNEAVAAAKQRRSQHQHREHWWRFHAAVVPIKGREDYFTHQVCTSLRCLCMLISIPSPRYSAASAVPPYETSGSGTPTTGSTPLTMPMLTKA